MTVETESGTEPADDAAWIRPSAEGPAEPRWGHAEGLQVGIAPLPGPRGLLRVYAPYLGHPRNRMINFIAVEPIPAGSTERGFSELEASALDGVQGKRFWATDDPDDATPRDPLPPARGVLEVIEGVDTLTVTIGCERFDNGADVTVRLRFRADRPHEVALAGFARPTSAPLSALVLTATMGNWARLRRLHLANRTVTPAELWPGFARTDFTEHAGFGLGELTRDGAAAVVAATTDEPDPLAADYADGTKEHWHYEGVRAVQSWRTDDPHPELRALVNGRWAYWASADPIPGGVAYENVELVEPFRQGAEFRFSVEPVD